MSSEANLIALQRELDWLQQVIQGQLENYLAAEPAMINLSKWLPPLFESDESALAQLVNKWTLQPSERLALALALAPHLRPHALDIFLLESNQTGRVLTELGGINDARQHGFLPTGQTLAFLLSANQPDAWQEYWRITSAEHCLMREHILYLEKENERSARINSYLRLSEAWLHYLLTGKEVRPEHEIDFPARPIYCHQDWDNLIVEQNVLSQLLEIRHWLEHGNDLLDKYKLVGKIKAGYRALFYGPPGTGKTLATCLLGKSMNKEVYRVDPTMVVSKYIGETEKNLGRVFDIAQDREWILFFDEADALFAKRTTATTSNDRHANQQTAYLLQRIEDFPGVVILATNLRANMDEAFTRRFQAIVQFVMPRPAERLRLWQDAFSDSLELASNIDLNEIADRFEVAGGTIINVLRACAIAAAAAKTHTVTYEVLLQSLRRELAKENKSLKLHKEIL